MSPSVGIHPPGLPKHMRRCNDGKHPRSVGEYERVVGEHIAECKLATTAALQRACCSPRSGRTKSYSSAMSKRSSASTSRILETIELVGNRPDAPPAPLKSGRATVPRVRRRSPRRR